MQKDWVVYSKHCLNHTDSIIGYLARYTHRIAISNQRIISIDQDQVKFSYTDYRDNRKKIMTLHCSEFIRRFLMHVLPKGLMRIRHYGILANRSRKASLTIIRQRLATPAPKKPSDEGHEPATYPCPVCKQGRLIFKHEITPVKVWRHPRPC
jgi:hypothetical protein